MLGLEKRTETLVAVITAFIVFSACAKTDFNAGPRKQMSADASSFSLQCDSNTGDSFDDFQVKDSLNAEVVLTGEFCGKPEIQASGDTTILFVIDHSDSMESGSYGAAGNDPLVGDSCGRLEAGRAIVEKMKSLQTSDTNINIAAISFSSSATVLAQPTNADDFDSHLNSQEFCGATGKTNYEGAIKEAHNLLKSVNGPAVIYFISDGYPTASNSPISGFINSMTGLEDEYFGMAESAANDLRNDPDLENVVFNAIFLGDATSVSGSNPKEDLARITGSLDRVRQVSNASDLAESIQTFEDPVNLEVNNSSAVGTLTSPSGEERRIQIASFKPHPSREDVWVFETEPFRLFGSRGEIVENEAIFEVESSGGGKLSARANISFESR